MIWESKSEKLKFADDTKGQKTIQGEEDRRKIQEALNSLWRWSQKWKVMHIGMNNLEYEYQVNGTKLNTTDEEKKMEYG
jgi:hypothetical protein